MSRNTNRQPSREEVSPDIAEAYESLKCAQGKLLSVNVRLQLLRFAGIEETWIDTMVDETCCEIEAFENSLDRFLQVQSKNILDLSLKLVVAQELKKTCERAMDCVVQDARRNVSWMRSVDYLESRDF